MKYFIIYTIMLSNTLIIFAQNDSTSTDWSDLDVSWAEDFLEKRQKEKELYLESLFPYELFELESNIEGDSVYYLVADSIQGDVTFDCKHLDYDISLAKCCFKGYVVIENYTGKNLDLRDLTFSKNVHIKNSSMDDLYISGVDVKSYMTIENIKVNERTNLSFVKPRVLSLINSQFNGNVLFDNCEIGEDLFLERLKFSSDFLLTESEFANNEGMLRMSNVDVKGKMSFYKTKIPIDLGFSDVTLQQELDFREINFGLLIEEYTIGLHGGSIDKFYIPFDRFSMVTDGEGDEGRFFDLGNAVFQKQLDKYKSLGHEENYKLLDIQYQYYLLNSNRSGLGAIGFYIRKYWWNFGHNKERILFNTLLIFLVFSMINTLVLKKLVHQVYTIKGIANSFPKSQKHSLINRFVTSLYYTGIVFFGLKMEIANLAFDKKWLVAYILFIYSSGLFCGAFIFNWIINF